MIPAVIFYNPDKKSPAVCGENILSQLYYGGKVNRGVVISGVVISEDVIGGVHV